MRIRVAAVLAAGCVWVALGSSANAQGPIPTPIPKGDITIELQAVATGLGQPVWLTTAGSDATRKYVVDRTGQVRIIENGQLLAQPFLAPPVVTGSERGLLGLAFHPGYDNPSSPGYRTLYTYNSESPSASKTYPVPAGGTADHDSVIVEWKASATNPNVVDTSTRREVMRIGQPQGNHNGGGLEFSPTDGYLYISLGDGGGANDVAQGHTPGLGNGQDTSNVLGDMLRIDPLSPSLTPGSTNPASGNGQYRLPADNPFVVNPTGGAPEIFASGFRNPFRFSFDSADGRLLVGDVGQNNVEEFDIVTLGGNYGWNRKEGTFLFNPTNGTVSTSTPIPGLIDPVGQYDHDEGISILGGFVYRGTALPELAGKYVFGDLLQLSRGSGRLFYADLTSGAISEFRIGPDDRNFGRRVLGFGEDANGELYVMGDINNVAGSGVVFQIVPVPEPTSLALMGIGTLGLIALMRRGRGVGPRR